MKTLRKAFMVLSAAILFAVCSLLEETLDDSIPVTSLSFKEISGQTTSGCVISSEVWK